MNNELHFGVYATHTISLHEEVTVPFDFRMEKLDYPLECGCGRKNCWAVRVAKGRGRGGRGEGVGERAEGEKTSQASWYVHVCDNTSVQWNLSIADTCTIALGLKIVS